MFFSCIVPEMGIFILLGDLPLHLTHAFLHIFIHTDSHTSVHTYMLHAYINTYRHTDRHTQIPTYLPTYVRAYAYTLICTFTLLFKPHHTSTYISYIYIYVYFAFGVELGAFHHCSPPLQAGSKKVKTEKLQKRIKELPENHQPKDLGKTMGVLNQI